MWSGAGRETHIPGPAGSCSLARLRPGGGRRDSVQPPHPGQGMQLGGLRPVLRGRAWRAEPQDEACTQRAARPARELQARGGHHPAGVRPRKVSWGVRRGGIVAWEEGW